MRNIEREINRQLERLIVAAMEIQAAANNLMDLRRELTAVQKGANE